MSRDYHLTIPLRDDTLIVDSVWIPEIVLQTIVGVVTYDPH